MAKKNGKKKGGKIVLIVVAIIAIFILILFLIPERLSPVLDLNGEPVESAVNLIETVELGGVEQALIIRGANEELPVLIEVHGGPGSPEFGAYRKYLPELEAYFIVVHWEQRGAGKSFFKPDSTDELLPSRFVDDLVELTGYLQEHFGKEKVFLLGHSWGSYLTMKAAYQNPEDYYAVINCGQLVNFTSNELVGYQKVLSEASNRNDEKGIEKLLAIGAPVGGVYKDGIRSLGVERSYVSAYGFSSVDTVLMRSFPVDAVSVPEYSFGDKVKYFRGIMQSLSIILGGYEEGSLNLFEEVPELEVPYYVFQGSDDYQTPIPIAKAYFDFIQADVKEFRVADNAAHLALFEKPDEFMDYIIAVRDGLID